jgi:hypothetical protein
MRNRNVFSPQDLVRTRLSANRQSRRDGDQVRQQVIATLGRFDELQASGQLERLLRSGARFAAKAMVLSAANDDAAIKIAVRRICAFSMDAAGQWEPDEARASRPVRAGAGV